jgi:hypothetical protein
LGLLFTVNNFPFCSHLYDQYSGDRGAAPYQNIIDYVDRRGGMTFWTHPDAESKSNVDGIEMNTPVNCRELLRTYNYTGFAVFSEGSKFTGKPGGVWDAVLKEYLDGRRKKAIWAIGEIDYKDGDCMGDVQTVFLVDHNDKAGVLKAMRDGKMYAVRGESKPVLQVFQVWDEHHGTWKDMGETADVTGRTRLRIKVSLPAKRRNAVLRLIRKGVVIKEISIDGRLDTEIDDASPKDGGITYYRLEVENSLISNPIFVNTKYKV